MPTENEKKVVLFCPNPDEVLSELKSRNRYAMICQGYLSRGKKLTCRVRYTLDSHTNAAVYSLTVKKEVNDRLIEIETEIDHRDFEDLWKVSKKKLSKVRVYVEDWEVDFFIGNDNIYFVMAEHEMPEGQENPYGMTAFVKDRVLYEVPKGDRRFSNKKLSKPNYAKEILSKLHQEKNKK